MKRLVPILLSVAAVILSAGCATTEPETAAVSREQVHAFVQQAKAEYGPNRDQWPEEVQAGFDQLFEAYLATRNPEVPDHE